MLATVAIPAAMQTGINAVFYQSPMVANVVSFCILAACYVGLLVWMFELSTFEAVVMATLIGIINVWIVGLFIGDFAGWVSGDVGSPAVTPLPAGAGGGG